MMRLFVTLVLLVWSGSALAVEVAGVKLEPQVQIGGETLNLNGYGIRKKLFFKIYIGSLYTAQKATRTEQVVDGTGSKLIRMDFLYSKVEKQKIVDAFAEGLANNSPQLMNSSAVKAFLSWFDADFIEKDRVDLAVAADGTVSVTHNGRLLGSSNAPGLAKGVLLIYLGNKPADESMKEGMLGGE
jgi:hypothetical protein